MTSNGNFLIGQLRAIRPRIQSSVDKSGNLRFEIANSLNQLREESINTCAKPIAETIQKFTQPVKSSNGNPPYPTNSSTALLLCDQLLAALQPDARPDTELQDTTINRITPESRTVFIVHGHDQVNLMRLQILLKDRFG